MALYLVPFDNIPPVPIDKSVLLFGRHPDCDVVLTHSRKVSRKHCCLAVVNNQMFLRDMGSMNGVRINGERVRKIGQVRVGDEVGIADVRYQVLPDPKAKPTPFKKVAKDKGAPKVASPKPPVAKPALQPLNLSQNFPVVIPDEPDKDFAVESGYVPAVPDSKLILPEWNELNQIPPDNDLDDIVIIDESSDPPKPKKGEGSIFKLRLDDKE